jgi:hypothetical protein
MGILSSMNHPLVSNDKALRVISRGIKGTFGVGLNHLLWQNWNMDKTTF